MPRRGVQRGDAEAEGTSHCEHVSSVQRARAIFELFVCTVCTMHATHVEDMDRATSDDDEDESGAYQHKGISADDLSDDWVEAQMKDVTVAVAEMQYEPAVLFCGAHMHDDDVSSI